MKNMKNKIMRRLRENCGESMVESMVTMVIVALAALVLAGSIISAAHVNAAAKKVVTFPKYTGTETNGTATLSGGFLTENITIGITIGNQDEGKMTYYEID